MFVNMSKNDQPEQDPWHLHLRKAKGEFLSDEEQNQLADWYRQQEQQERAMVRMNLTILSTVVLPAISITCLLG